MHWESFLAGAIMGALTVGMPALTYILDFRVIARDREREAEARGYSRGVVLRLRKDRYEYRYPWIGTILRPFVRGHYILDDDIVVHRN